MKSLSIALLVSLSIGVAAPVAARPRVPVTAWPGVSDVLMNVKVAGPVAALPRAPVAAWPTVTDYSDIFRMSTPSNAAMFWCSDFSLLRLVAEFRRFDGNEDATDQPPPGISIYGKLVEVPDGCDTLYVTISAVGDGHGGNATWLTCKVDFTFCNPGPSDATDTDGWIAVQRHGVTQDLHDNSVYYTWCTAITPGTHVVEIRMASSANVPTRNVYLEAEHFYVDASNTGGGCVQATVDDPKPLVPDPHTGLGTTPSAAAPTPVPPTLPPLPKLP